MAVHVKNQQRIENKKKTKRNKDAYTYLDHLSAMEWGGGGCHFPSRLFNGVAEVTVTVLNKRTT